MRREWIAVGLVLLTTVITVLAAVLYEKYRVRKLQVIDLVARAPDNGNWDPRTLQVEAGKKVRLRIRNVETVSHGFAIPELGVGVPEIKPGQVIIVEFTPEKAGTYPFMCTVWCSDKHMQMSGQLVVSGPMVATASTGTPAGPREARAQDAR